MSIGLLRNLAFAMFLGTVTFALKTDLLAYHTWSNFVASANATCTSFGDSGEMDPLNRDVDCFCDADEECDDYTQLGFFCSEFWDACTEYCEGEWGTHVDYAQGAFCDIAPAGADATCWCYPKTGGGGIVQ